MRLGLYRNELLMDSSIRATPMAIAAFDEPLRHCELQKAIVAYCHLRSMG